MTIEFSPPTTVIRVRRKGRRIGEIRRVRGGWQFYTSQNKKSGATFTHLRDCKSELNGENS